MAKKSKKARATRRAATAASRGATLGGDDWINGNGYTLTMSNSPASFVFQLDVQGQDGKPYFLRVNNFNENVGTVQKLLRVIADRWPAFAFQFKADDGGSITDTQ